MADVFTAPLVLRAADSSARVLPSARATPPGLGPRATAHSLLTLPQASEVGVSDPGLLKVIPVASMIPSLGLSRTRRGAGFHASKPLLAIMSSWTPTCLSTEAPTSRRLREAEGAGGGVVGVPRLVLPAMFAGTSTLPRWPLEQSEPTARMMEKGEVAAVSEFVLSTRLRGETAATPVFGRATDMDGGAE